MVSIGGYNIMEMWHGSTGSMKDFALTIVTRFLNYLSRRDGFKGMGVVGTLGDTGCAAIHSCIGIDNIRLVVLYPADGVSEMQRLSMTTVDSPYIRVFECECVSDEFDSSIKAVFNDQQFADKNNLVWLNSCNICRVLASAVWHIHAYCQICPEFDRNIDIYLPTGGAGNAAGGVIVQQMGLPINIVLAVNENDAIHKCLSLGSLQQPPSIVKTHACALDSATIPNIERILYQTSHGNSVLVKELMEKFEQGLEVVIPADIQSTRIRSVRVEQHEALHVAKRLWNEHKYMICPHTAVGVAAVDRSDNANTAVCYSTATSAKFANFIQAVDVTAPLTTHPLTLGLEGKVEHKHIMKVGENWTESLKHAIEELQSID